MPRIRTIKPEFPASRSVGNLSRDARLFFLQLLCFVDDAGRCRYLTRTLLGDLYPYDEDVDEKVLESWVEECAAQGMLETYDADGETILRVVNFLKHQRINRPTPSNLPPPPENEPSLNTQTQLTEGSRQERKGKERKGETCNYTSTGSYSTGESKELREAPAPASLAGLPISASPPGEGEPPDHGGDDELRRLLEAQDRLLARKVRT